MVTTWPCDTGGASGYYPAEDLFVIISRAVDLAPVVTAVDVIDWATKCALNHDAAGGTTAVNHCKYVLSARHHATLPSPDWPMCIEALKHADGLVEDIPAVAPATDWPCDQGDAPPAMFDADQLLWEVIQLANQTAPASDWEWTIRMATTCALTHDTAPAPNSATASAHCLWLKKAKSFAAAGNWFYCIGALEHQSGGSDPGTESESESESEEGTGESTPDMETIVRALPVRLRRRVRTTIAHVLQLLRDIIRFEIARESGKFPPSDGPIDP